MAKEELTAKVVAAPGAAITLDFKMATELLKMFGEEPGLITLQHGSESSHSGTGLYAWYSDIPDEGAEFLGAEPDDEAVPEAAPAQDALAYQEACSLATSLFKKHFSKDVEYASGKVTWGLCDTTAGVISQIDNMVCGLVEPTAQAAPDFQSWVHMAYRSPEATRFTIHNMEVAYKAGRDSASAQAASVDAERYRWLFDARTKSQAESFSGTINNPLPQDVVISHLQGFFMHKAQVDEMVDTAMAAQKGGAT